MLAILVKNHHTQRRHDMAQASPAPGCRAGVIKAGGIDKIHFRYEQFPVVVIGKENRPSAHGIKHGRAGTSRKPQRRLVVSAEHGEIDAALLIDLNSREEKDIDFSLLGEAEKLVKPFGQAVFRVSVNEQIQVRCMGIFCQETACCRNR